MRYGRFFKWIKWLLFGLVIFIGTCIIAGYTYESVSRKRTLENFPPPGQLVDLGTHKLHVRIIGSGNETIVFDAGAGQAGSYSFIPIERELKKHARLITYDRAGINWSEKGPGERNGVRIADELYNLLQKLEIKEPIVLVGHSQGGLHIIQFAKKYRSMVKALVLLDAPLPSSYNDMPQEVKTAFGVSADQIPIGLFMANMGVMRLMMPPLDGISFKAEGVDLDLINRSIDALLPATMANGVFPEMKHTVMNNDIEVNEGMLDSLPIRIISSRSFMRNLEEAPPGWNQELDKMFEDYWERNQRELLKLSNQTSRQVLDSSGHNMHMTTPETVIKAILSVIEN